MERLDPKSHGATPDIVAQNIEKMKELFPDVFTEGKVDFDALRETLGDYVDDRPERYSFNWNGKAKARRIAQTPSSGTLRPCPKESVNWDTTQNLFIEGDNLEVLKLLQKSYHKKVKMIYIDPPYNTGGDRIYPDDFRDNIKNYLKLTGQTNEEGRLLPANAETGGRYHTSWLNMMFPRLKLARNLLRDDGVVFISIDDSEVANLRKLCDELFGEENLVANIVWARKRGKDNSAKFLSRNHEHLVVYAKNIGTLTFDRLEMPSSTRKAYSNPDNDTRGDYRLQGIWARGTQGGSKYPFVASTGEHFSERLWLVGESTMHDLDKDQRLVFRGDKVYKKLFLSEYKGDIPETIWLDASNAANAADEIKSIFGFQVFDTVKPIPYLNKMLLIGTSQEGIILDFFAGSCATAHAVLDANMKDNGKRTFIMVQLPEPCAEKSEAFKAGYGTIAEIGKERIRRVIKKIEAEQAEKAKEAKSSLPGTTEDVPELDLGFKVFKLDASNIVPWDADFDNLETALLDSVENIKLDRTETDVLYELLLKYGLDLAVPIEERQIGGKTVYIIGAGALIVCLAKEIGLDVVEGIAALKDELKPELMRVVFKDAGFKDDVVKTNTVQILKQAGVDDVKSL